MGINRPYTPMIARTEKDAPILVRQEQDINAALKQCVKVEDEEEPTGYPGYTYEDGVATAIRWLLYGDSDHPFSYGQAERP
jgi:hypothetical protein